MEQSAANSAPEQPAATSGNPLVAAGIAAGNTPAAAAPAQPTAAYRPEDDVAWIEKAKQVIKRSSGDPWTRHDALNKLKVQYIKQRYGISIGEEPSK